MGTVAAAPFYSMVEVVPISTQGTNPLEHLIAALTAGDESTRLKAALAIGSNPERGLVDILVARCAIEPDFCAQRAGE
jgi:hypothetical protein